MIKNIFFDFNGTLLDDLKLCADVEAEISREYGLPVVDINFYLDNFCFPVKDYYEKCGFDFTKIDYKDISKRFFEGYLAKEETETHLHKGVKETLKKLKEKNVKLYCYSASERTILEKQLNFFGILDYFDGIIASDNRAAKGKLEYGKEYILNHNIDTKNTIMLGDTAHDFEVAKALGLTPVLVNFGHNSEKVLKALNVPIISKFSDILDIAEKY